MTSIGEIHARPGGSVVLHFDEAGYRPQPRRGPVSWLLDDAGCALSVVLMVGFGGAAIYAQDAGLTSLTIALAVVAAPWTLVVTVRLVGEAIGGLAGYLMLAGMVLLLPFMVFPGVRRWARRRWRAPAVRVRDPGARVPAGKVISARVHHDGDAVTVVVDVGGEVVAYTGHGVAGVAVEREFRRLLGPRLS